jgi:hypothetical protein
VWRPRVRSLRPVTPSHIFGERSSDADTAHRSPQFTPSLAKPAIDHLWSPRRGVNDLFLEDARWARTLDSPGPSTILIESCGLWDKDLVEPEANRQGRAPKMPALALSGYFRRLAQSEASHEAIFWNSTRLSFLSSLTTSSIKTFHVPIPTTRPRPCRSATRIVARE